MFSKLALLSIGHRILARTLLKLCERERTLAKMAMVARFLRLEEVEADLSIHIFT